MVVNYGSYNITTYIERKEKKKRRKEE